MKKWITVTFYPNLSHYFGDSHTVWARSPAQAIGIIARRVGLQKWESYFIEASKRGERYHIVCGGKLLSEQELTKLGTSRQVYIVPVIEGALFGVIGSILVGGGLIGVGAGLATGIVADVLISLGASLILGGIQQLFAPGRERRDADQNPQSFGFGSNVPEFGKLGTPIPVLYGEMVIKDPIVISAYSEVKTVSYVPEDESGDGADDDTTKRSETTFRVLYLIGHGRITGFSGSARDSVFFNEQPLSAILNDNTSVASPKLYDGSQTNPIPNHQLPSTFKTSPSSQDISSEPDLGGGDLSFEIPNPFWSIESSYDPSQDLQSKNIRIGLRFSIVLFFIEAEATDGDPQEEGELIYTVTIEDGSRSILVQDQFTEYAQSQQGYEKKDNFDLPPRKKYRITIEKNSRDGQKVVELESDFYARYENTLKLLSYEIALLNSSSLAIYNGYALLDVEFPAKVFSEELPSTAVSLKGKMCPIIKNDGTLERGSNGNLALQWSDNPANILMDILINQEFGLGTFLAPNGNYEENINVASFRELKDYAEEQVNGNNRFRFNAYLTSTSDSLTLLRDIGETARTTFYNAEGEISAVIDRFRGGYGDTYLVFDDSNVAQKVDDEGNAVSTFEYGSSELTARKTVININYFNQDDFYKQDSTWVNADSSALNKYGTNLETVTAIGQTSEKYARQYGRNTLAKELTRNRIVTFRTGAIGLWLNPGRVIQVEDPRVGYVLLYEILSRSEAQQGIEFEITALIYIPENYDYIDLRVEQSPPTLNPVDNNFDPIPYPPGEYLESVGYSTFNPEDIDKYEPQWDTTPIEINKSLSINVSISGSSIIDESLLFCQNTPPSTLIPATISIFLLTYSAEYNSVTYCNNSAPSTLIAAT